MIPVTMELVESTDDGSPRVCQDLAPIAEPLTRQPQGLTERDTELVSTSFFGSIGQIISVCCCPSVSPARGADKR